MTTTPTGPVSPLDKAIKESELKSAQDYTKKVRTQLLEESADSRKSYETFHTNLALFASGTLALSVTYLGYLKSTGVSVIHIKTLIACWTCLMLTIPLALFVSFLHSHHISYGRMAEYQEAMSTQRKAEADSLGTLPVVNLKPDEIAAERDERLKAAQRHSDAATKAQRKGELYYRLWRVFGFAARSMFVLGLFFLYVFAVWTTIR